MFVQVNDYLAQAQKSRYGPRGPRQGMVAPTNTSCGCVSPSRLRDQRDRPGGSALSQVRLRQRGRSAFGNPPREQTSGGGTLDVPTGRGLMIRLVRDTARERQDDGTDASARLLQHWVRAVTRDRVLRGAVVWPRVAKQDDRREQKSG